MSTVALGLRLWSLKAALLKAHGPQAFACRLFRDGRIRAFPRGLISIVGLRLFTRG